MTDNRIDFEDCGAFVRIDDVRIRKISIDGYGPCRVGVVVFVDFDDVGLSFFGNNFDEVLSAIDEAMRGAR